MSYASMEIGFLNLETRERFAVGKVKTDKLFSTTCIVLIKCILLALISVT
jgi:hypothetical protein